MGWKKWPSWLKGGVIGVIIDIIFFFIFLLRECDYTEALGNKGCSWSFNNLTHLFNEDLTVKFIALLILLAGFLIGALIGWIVGKMKSKKK